MAELQATEDDLARAAVVLVGGTRPAVSTAMVSSFLFERFDITVEDADMRRHDLEDFIVRFRHQADRDRVLATRPGGSLLPLLWRPWQWTSTANGGCGGFPSTPAMRL